MWLKGFLDGINSVLIPPSAGDSATPSSPAATPAGLPVTILWGSQTGNAEALGKKLAKSLTAKGHSPTLRNMADFSRDDLSAAGHVFIITSTYGDGEPPDNAAALYSALHSREAPALKNVNFAVLALGDSNYPDFCKCGHDFHKRLTELGAKPIIPIIECDVDYDEPFAKWMCEIDKTLAAA